MIDPEPDMEFPDPDFDPDEDEAMTRGDWLEFWGSMLLLLLMGLIALFTASLVSYV